MAIIGGGIGGLTAALAMWQQGVNVHVYEQAQEFKEVGAGVALGPNALRLLKRLGVEAKVAEVAAYPTGYEMRRADGKVIIETHSSGPLQRMRSATVHRAHLLKILEHAVPAERLHTGMYCAGLEDTGPRVLARFANGDCIEADAVIGADGIHSVVRAAHYDDAPKFSGTVAYRGLIPMERLPTLKGEREHLTFWIGPRQHFLTFPVARGELMNLVAFVPADEGWATESWTAPGEVDDLFRYFDGWAPAVTSVLEGLDSTMRWALYDRDPLPQWTFGRVTLLGDAAHAMLPHQGQGAVQSIEDGVVLARCLGAAERDTVNDWLELYQNIRQPRTERVQAASRAAGETYSMDDPVEQERRVPAGLATRGDWLWNYDADEAFEDAVRAWHHSEAR